jgi:ATP-dependent helicase HepA
MEMEDLAPRTYYLHPASAITGVFPTIPPQGISVTFDRKRALAREDISFLTWDHPMTTGAIDMVLSSGTGSASFGVMRGTGSRAILLEFLFVLETAGERGIYVDRFLPNTPLRIVIDHTCEEVTDEYPVETFDEQLMPGQIDVLLDNEQFMETVLPQMISMATTIAEYQGAQKMAEGLERMNLVLEHEINRLTLLQTKNRSIRPAEIQTAKDEKTNLTASIKDARIRLDSLQLIMKE